MLSRYGYLAAAGAIRADPLTASPAFIALPPLWPLLLAVAPDLRVALAIEVTLAALVVLPVVRIASRYGSLSAWVAGLLAALSPQLLPWTPYLLTDMLGLVLIGTAVERLTAAGAHRNADKAA